MGTFEGHLIPGAAFVLWGLWLLCNVIVAYLAQPASFHTRAWYAFPRVKGRLRYLELVLVAFGAAMSIASEMVLAQPGHWMLDKDGHIPIYMMAQFEHASMSLFLFLYAVVGLSTEGFFVRCRPLPFGFLHLLLASALGQMFLLFYYHSGDHMGVEGHYHELLRIPLALALSCTLLEMAWPSSSLLPLGRAGGIMLSGLVLIQTALSIWIPSLVPLHCGPTAEHSIWCEDEKWVHRAKALANLEFNWWCAVVLVVMVLLFLVLRNIFGMEEYFMTENDNVEGRWGEEVLPAFKEATARREEGEDGAHTALL